MTDRIHAPDTPGNIDEAALVDDLDPHGGSGGSSGGGSIEGSGEVAGGTTDREATFAGTAHGIAAEAAALGDADGSLADAGLIAAGRRSNAGADPARAETVGVGAGPGSGSGTPADRGDLGGAGAGPGPAGSRSSGGDGRA